MIQLGIRLRVFLAIMTVIVGLQLVTGWVMRGLVDQYLDTEIRDTLQRGRQAYDSLAAVHKAVFVDQARSLAQAPHLRAVLGTPDVDQDTVGVTLSSLGETVEGNLLFVTDGAGRLIADNRGRELPDIRQSADLQQAIAGDESYGIWDYGGHDYFVALSPIHVASTQLGVLGLGYPIEEQVRELSDATGLDVTVLHDERVVASRWDLEEAQGSKEAPSLFYQALDWSRVLPDVRARLEVDGRELMATSVSLAPASYRLVLTRPLDHLLQQFRRAKVELALVGLLIAGVAVLVSRWVAERIAHPIRSLTKAARTLASGDLTAHVSVTSSDEVGTLAQTFNSMARQLESAMHEVVQKARAAEHANEAKSAFLATISHELRTPLNAILGFNEQLKATTLSSEQQDFVKTAQQSGEELLALIDKLLDFAKMESGGFRIEPIEFDLHECLIRAVDSMTPTLRKKGLGVDVSVSPELPRTVVGGMSQLRQVLSQYLSNAAKFTPAGSVSIRATLASQDAQEFMLRVEVQDTGIGVSPDQIGRLFKAFSQVETTAARSYSGTGVGLAIAKDLVHLMNGDVGVSSEPGKGSTFWFTTKLTKPLVSQTPIPPAIPVAPGPIAKITPPTPENDASATARRAGQRILVVEDNPVNQKIACVVLKKAGWSHEVAEDGRCAVDMASAARFDLILMDCQMPRMDGFEATRLIRTSDGLTPRSVPIVALTANAFEADRQACLDAGMDDFMAKPFKSPELVQRIEHWLTARAPAEQLS
jgi:signal transduction histidine kinase/ActR/RegA family two-component response regulator